MDKKIMFLAASVGATIGGYVANIFGADYFSIWSVVCGGLVGVAAIILVNRYAG
jgi:hypothetical protein